MGRLNKYSTEEKKEAHLFNRTTINITQLKKHTIYCKIKESTLNQEHTDIFT